MKTMRKNSHEFIWHDLEDFENIQIDTKGVFFIS